MTSKTKILFFDEGIHESTREYRISVLVEICKKYEGIIKFETSVLNYFDFLDNSGNEINILFDINEMDFVFIHHSFNLPSAIPSNCFAILKQKLNEKLIVFSGDMPNSIKDGRLRRDDVYKHFKEFLEIHSLIGEWVPEVFTDRNAIRSLAEHNLELYRTALENDLSSSFVTKAFKNISFLLRLDTVKLANYLNKLDELSVMEYLETKINLL